jgi:hypothetical protein
MSMAQITAENQIRMEKNRILAREGRLRKKGFVDDLKVQLAAAERRDIKQRKELAAAINEIRMLRNNLKIWNDAGKTAAAQMPQSKMHHPNTYATVASTVTFGNVDKEEESEEDDESLYYVWKSLCDRNDQDPL